MTWFAGWPPPGAEPLGAGVWRAPGPDGSHVVVKRGDATGDEASGLERLASVEGGPRVPRVLYCRAGLLAIEWIEPGPRSAAQEADLGRRLAVMHSTDAGCWGGGSSWIGDCRVDPEPVAGSAEFYGRRLGDLAGRAGLAGVVGKVLSRLESLIPPGRPALVHGDLWWGNVIWAADGRPALIDPSVHGGHPEEDLAMLSLFGPIASRLLGSYLEARALDDGWQERVAFWQLYPLLVHAVLFGGSYRTRAEEVARRFSA